LRWTRAGLGRLGLAALCVGALSTTAQPAGESYAGKTVRIVVGYPPGGGFDTYSRLVARHLPQHIPGKPAVVVEHMPGAASLIAANYAYKVARPDGLTLVSFNGNQILGQALGRAGVEFEARRFGWLGAPLHEVTVCTLARRRGIFGIRAWQASSTPVKLGSTGAGGATHDVAKLLQATLGLPIHLVRGYRGAAEIRLAVESGEVDGFCGLWESVKTVWRDGLESGVALAMIQAGARPLPALPGVPMAIDLVRTEEARQLIRAGLILPGTLARGYAVPPGMSPDLVRILRTALLETLNAPDLLAEARRINLEVDPVSGEQLEQAVNELFSLDAAVVSRLRELLP
jgi:tripartite-type tricarboxylate transporter receptor subunit TctC